VYCGTKGPITVDHVPPRSFYPSTPPGNLITVPSCRKCNQAFGKDDDYVRLVFATAEGAMGNPARDELIPTLKRFADRKESKRILKSVYDSLSTGYYPNQSGVLVKRDRFVIEGERLDAFARRTVKALFYREKGHRLPDEYGVNVIHYRRMKDVFRASGADGNFWAFIISELNGKDLYSWGAVFAYSWLQSPNDPEVTWWMLHFYGNPIYLCSTRRTDAESKGKS
jgi:hypothetical protein